MGVLFITAVYSLMVPATVINCLQVLHDLVVDELAQVRGRKRKMERYGKSKYKG